MMEDFLREFAENSYVYFVHSYYLKAEEEQIVKASTEYTTHIHASVEKDNIFACQFHPEKSSDVGLKNSEKLCRAVGGVRECLQKELSHVWM